MAITISGEMSTKQKVRANLRGGANSFSGDPTSVVNAATTASGLWRLSVPGTSSYTISGTNGVVTLTSASTVSGLQGLIQSIVPSNVAVFVPGATANYLKQTTTDILLSSGVALTISGAANFVASGITAPATLTNFYISAADFATAYPNYTGTPNATPTWVDDALVHNNVIYGFGAIIASGTGTQTFSTQVRQIQTGQGPDGSLETQQWDGYFAVYSGSLNQTQQKNTKQQQC